MDFCGICGKEAVPEEHGFWDKPRGWLVAGRGPSSDDQQKEFGCRLRLERYGSKGLDAAWW